MCLAKVYVDDASGTDGAENAPPRLVMENVTRILVDGTTIHVASLLGQTEEVQGRIESMDFVEGRLLIVGTA